MFVKMSLRDRLFCLADFVGKTLLAVFFFGTATQVFSQSLSSHNLCSCIEFLVPVTISAILGAAYSNKSTPTHFAAGTIYLRKNGIAVIPINCASAPNPRPRCQPVHL